MFERTRVGMEQGVWHFLIRLGAKLLMFSRAARHKKARETVETFSISNLYMYAKHWIPPTQMRAHEDDRTRLKS